MFLHAPLGLLWLGGLPVLIWLWRLSGTRRRLRIPSLVPFEHLLKREARQRSILVVNALFWLQLLACFAIAFALAQPSVLAPRSRTVLIVVDTSASMAGGEAMDRAKRALLAQVARIAPIEPCFLMTTAPVAPVLPQPTSDPVALARAIRGLHAQQLGGSLATAVRIGQALLSRAPEKTVVVTDEPRPPELPSTLTWISVGEPLSNAAIVGLDAQGPLCSVAESRVVATIQNFSKEPRTVRVTAARLDRRVAETREPFAPSERRAIPLALPTETTGLVEVAIDTPGDRLDADNRAWIDVRRAETHPIVIRSRRAAFTDTLSAWLGACPGLTWTSADATAHASPLLITDQEDDAEHAAGPLMRFVPPTAATPVLSHWVASSDHPVVAYLAPVQAVGAALNVQAGMSASGLPVISAVVNGLRVPVVVADERDGRRLVSMFLDPAGGEEPTPLLLTFFNSLRWLLGGRSTPMTGEPVLVEGLAPGTVKVHRPDGSIDLVAIDESALQYDATTLAGRYTVSQGAAETSFAVNFFDPIESNLMDRASTWRAAQPTAPVGPRRPERLASPLTNWLLLLLLLLLLLEWWWYSRAGRSAHPAERA